MNWYYRIAFITLSALCVGTSITLGIQLERFGIENKRLREAQIDINDSVQKSLDHLSKSIKLLEIESKQSYECVLTTIFSGTDKTVIAETELTIPNKIYPEMKIGLFTVKYITWVPVRNKWVLSCERVENQEQEIEVEKLMKMMSPGLNWIIKLELGKPGK